MTFPEYLKARTIPLERAIHSVINGKADEHTFQTILDLGGMKRLAQVAIRRDVNARYGTVISEYNQQADTLTFDFNYVPQPAISSIRFVAHNVAQRICICPRSQNT